MNIQTVIITGNINGGTSIVSALCQRLGFYMGESNPCYEDNDLLEVMRDDRLIEKAIERDNEYGKWGFKAPLLNKELFHIEKKIENPYFIAVYRDPVAVNTNITEVCDLQFEMSKVVPKLQKSYSLSYEKLLQFPHRIIGQLADFLEIPLSANQVDDLAQLVKSENGYPII